MQSFKPALYSAGERDRLSLPIKKPHLYANSFATIVPSGAVDHSRRNVAPAKQLTLHGPDKPRVPATEMLAVRSMANGSPDVRE
jgi:hypothetical protein